MYNETYRTDPQAAFEGQIADMSSATTVSRTVEAEIGFGEAVVRGTNEHTVRAIATGDTKVHGFTVRTQGTDAQVAGKYPVGDTATVLRKGPIWLTVSATVAAGDKVYVDPDTGDITNVATDNVEVVGAEFETGATSGNIAKVHIL